MPVDGAHVIEAEFFEHRPAGHHAAGILFRLFEPAPHAAAHLAGDLRCHRAKSEVLAARHHAREIGREATDRRSDRHVVVVEDHDQSIAGLFGVVHRLIGHARAHRAVADNRDAAAGTPLHPVGHGKAECRADRSRGVRCTERIVFAFRTLGEARKAAALAQGADPVTATGQDLVRIALVPDVPDELVGRRIENIMDGRRKLDHAEARTKVSTGRADSIDHLRAQLVGELAQLGFVEFAKICRSIDCIQQGRIGARRHGSALHGVFTTVDERLVASHARTGGDNPQAPHSSHRPRSSTTGRTSTKPASLPASRSAPVTRSSSICRALPQSSQIRKMQSWRQPGCVLTR